MIKNLARKVVSIGILELEGSKESSDKAET
jgi:hypothetical protein